MTAAATAMTPQELSRLLERFTRPGVPKYTALRDAVVHAVASGRFVPGDRVPNEQELAGTLPISLGTIQRALRQLVEEGVVQRRQGQGSFIAGRADDEEMSQPFHCRFIDDSGRAYLPVYPQANGRRTVKGPAPWEHVLGTGEALEITRRIRIGDEFAVHSSFIVDAKRLPVFATLTLKQLKGQNFKDLIFRASGQAIQRVDLFLKQARVPQAVAAAIDVGPRTECMSLRAIAYLGESDPIYYQQIFIPPTQRELHIAADNRASGFRG